MFQTCVFKKKNQQNINAMFKLKAYKHNTNMRLQLQ